MSLADKFGLSWQIVPTALQEMLQDADGEKTNRVLEVFLTMKKLDIAALRRAYETARAIPITEGRSNRSTV